jgi:hypothetical protein
VTDSRTTDRLLEVIEARSEAVYGWLVDDQPAASAADQARHDVVEIIAAVVELRRRGDTLVRATDLRAVADGISSVSTDVAAARTRIDQALGMRLE